MDSNWPWFRAWFHLVPHGFEAARTQPMDGNLTWFRIWCRLVPHGLGEARIEDMDGNWPWFQTWFHLVPHGLEEATQWLATLGTSSCKRRVPSKCLAFSHALLATLWLATLRTSEGLAAS